MKVGIGKFKIKIFEVRLIIFTEKFLPRRGRINCSMKDKMVGGGWELNLLLIKSNFSFLNLLVKFQHHQSH